MVTAEELIPIITSLVASISASIIAIRKRTPKGPPSNRTRVVVQDADAFAKRLSKSLHPPGRCDDVQRHERALGEIAQSLSSISSDQNEQKGQISKQGLAIEQMRAKQVAISEDVRAIYTHLTNGHDNGKSDRKNPDTTK